MNRKVINKRALWIRFRQWRCKHPVAGRIELFRSYQERYVQEECKTCGKHIYTDL